MKVYPKDLYSKSSIDLKNNGSTMRSDGMDK